MAVTSLEINQLKIPAPQIAPGYRGYDVEDLRKGINDAVEPIGDTINNIIIVLDNMSIGAIGAVFDGGGSALTAGLEVEVPVPFAGTIVGVVIVADQSGDIEFEVEKSTFAAYPTLTSIVASAPPTISAAEKSEDTTLTGWTVAVVAGDIYRFSITSVSTITRAEISLKVLKTT
jgi:hypothetical protein